MHSLLALAQALRKTLDALVPDHANPVSETPKLSVFTDGIAHHTFWWGALACFSRSSGLG